MENSFHGGGGKIKILKLIGAILLIVFVVFVILLIASTINHMNQLKKEAKAHLLPGVMVDINGKKLHIYSEGEGNIPLVFMAGHGTSNPTLDFKPIWTRMTDEYRIAVVEKSGYGWSETSDTPRDIDTMLEETRKALLLSGEKGPYVLFPHSMSGLEALYWAQKYPDEVKAIIGLDPCTPQTIDILPVSPRIQLYALYFISRMGLSRFMPDSEVEEALPLMKSAELLWEDKNQYLAIFFKSAFTKDMLREVNYLKDNAETVAKNEVPISIPMYFFVSNDQEVSVIGWKKAVTDYLAKMDTVKYMYLDTGHYVHYEKADIIAEEAKKFLEDII